MGKFDLTGTGRYAKNHGVEACERPNYGELNTVNHTAHLTDSPLRLLVIGGLFFLEQSRVHYFLVVYDTDITVYAWESWRKFY